MKSDYHWVSWLVLVLRYLILLSNYLLVGRNPVDIQFRDKTRLRVRHDRFWSRLSHVLEEGVIVVIVIHLSLIFNLRIFVSLRGLFGTLGVLR